MKVAIAVSAVFHIEHLKRIYQQWEESEFVLFTAKESAGTAQMFAHLEQMRARARHVSDYVANGDRADVMISVYWQPAFLVMGPNTIHVRVMYGYAKDDWNYGDWNRNYDLILAYGPYAEERLKDHAPCLSVGHPRGPVPDRYGGESCDLLPVRRHRPVLLYCPTYGAMSSLAEFDRILAELADAYEVVVKLHHMSHAEKYPCLTRLVRESRIRLFDQRVDLFDLLPSCDLVISDHSGAIFDAMLLEKNIVLIDSDEMKAHIQAELDSNTANLDIQVRRVLPHYEISDIVAGIRETLACPPDYRPFTKRLYAGTGTNVPERIREEVMACFDRFSGGNRQQELYMRLVRFMEKDQRALVILGAGDFGQAVMQLGKSRGCAKICFVDGDPAKHGHQIEGIGVFSPKDADDFDPSTHKCVVATVGGATSYEPWLQQAGFAKNEDYVLAF